MSNKYFTKRTSLDVLQGTRGGGGGGGVKCKKKIGDLKEHMLNSDYVPTHGCNDALLSLGFNFFTIILYR